MAAPVITSILTATGNKSEVFAGYTITATNTPTSFAATGLPTGLTINTSTGAITGTPTVSGTITGTIHAINADGNTSAALVFTITAKPILASVNDTAPVFNGATLSATINPNGLATSYHFVYGTTTGYGTSTPTTALGSGTSPLALSLPLVGLAALTTYHYALVATNSSGTTTIADGTFTTTDAEAAAQALATEVLAYITAQNKARRLQSTTETSFRAKIVSWNARLASIVAAE